MASPPPVPSGTATTAVVAAIDAAATPLPPDATPAEEFISGGLTPYAIVGALVTIAAIVLIALLVVRMRRMNPAAFGRAVANGSLFLCAKSLLMLVDVGVDVTACVSVLADEAMPPVVRGLFGVITVIAVSASLGELALVAHGLRQVLGAHPLDVDGTAALNRRLDYAELFTMCVEDAPMLVITAFVAATADEVGNVVLIAAILSSFMLGLKCQKIGAVFYHLHAGRSYETDGAAEAVALSEDDAEVLVQTLDDFLEFADEAEMNAAETPFGDIDELEKAKPFVASRKLRGDSDVIARATTALADFRMHPLDMDAPQTHVDVFAVVLELVYPHRFQHLQRAAEATAQALTRDHVSQNEFYAVVLPYLMLLYDKEFTAAALPQASSTPDASRSQLAAGGASSRRKSRIAQSMFPPSADGDNGNDVAGDGAADFSADADAADGFSAVELVRQRRMMGREAEAIVQQQKLHQASTSGGGFPAHLWGPIDVMSQGSASASASLASPSASPSPQGARIVDIDVSEIVVNHHVKDADADGADALEDDAPPSPMPAAHRIRSVRFAATPPTDPVAVPARHVPSMRKAAAHQAQQSPPPLEQVSTMTPSPKATAPTVSRFVTMRLTKLARHTQKRQEREVLDLCASTSNGPDGQAAMARSSRRASAASGRGSTPASPLIAKHPGPGGITSPPASAGGVGLARGGFGSLFQRVSTMRAAQHHVATARRPAARRGTEAPSATGGSRPQSSQGPLGCETNDRDDHQSRLRQLTTDLAIDGFVNSANPLVRSVSGFQGNGALSSQVLSEDMDDDDDDGSDDS